MPQIGHSVQGQVMATLTHGGDLSVDIDALHHATTDNSLELLFQPEVELDSGAIVAMEALVRWRHPRLGVLAPPDFMELAERCGVMTDIDTWVLTTGAAELEGWQSLRGPARRLWLNVSLAQLHSKGFVDTVARTVADHGLTGGVLGFEISEKCVLELGSSALPLLQALRAAGVSLVVDDFSSMYSTLGAISSLPVDAVKLSQRYVRGVGDAEHDDAFVAHVIRHAHSRGMYVVAQGVETWSEAARLTELGCDRAHGWLFASPQRPDKARWLLSQGTGWRGGVVTPESRTVPFPTQRIVLPSH
jgi:EAL domain-containing protein (putative c-di-GMP-specific phosphodiesterase class I)